MAYDDRFWDSQSGDRIYNASEWDAWARSIATDGYVHDISHLNGGLHVRQADPADMSVNVDTGHMWIDGKHFRVHTSAENLGLSSSDGGNDRIDRAVVRVDRSTRRIYPTIKTGTAGINPSPPSLQQDNSIWELSLALIHVGADATSIEDSDITDDRVRSISLPAGIPPGAVILWSGSISSIPEGWSLCDGTNGTPDLRNRFIVAAGQTYSPNDTGGEIDVILGDDQIPAHDHGISGSHGHSIYYEPTDVIQGGALSAYSNTTTGSGPGSAGVFEGGTHSHNTFGGHESKGTTMPHENRPPYYALAYIMKL